MRTGIIQGHHINQKTFQVVIHWAKRTKKLFFFLKNLWNMKILSKEVRIWWWYWGKIGSVDDLKDINKEEKDNSMIIYDLNEFIIL